MDSRLHLLLARARSQELLAAADRPGISAGEDDAAIPATTPVTLRFAFPNDAAALGRLSALDSSEPPAMPVLLGEVGGELRAALSLADGAVVADPFHPTVALVELLRARARQLQGRPPARRLSRLRTGALSLRSAWR